MIRVVIVEDEMLVRMGLKTCIEAERDISVDGAFDSAERALAYFETSQADVIITDIRLPGMTGLELIHQLRARFPAIIMVVLSAYEDFSYARKAIAYGANHYILKHELDEEKLPQIIRDMVKDVQPPQAIHAHENNLSGDVAQYCGEQGARIMCFHFRGRESVYTSTKDELNLDMVSELVCTALEDANLGHGYLYNNHQVIALLRGKPNDLSQLKACFQTINDSLNLYADTDCFGGVSNWFSAPETLPAAIDEAGERAALAFYYQEPCLLLTQRTEAGSCPLLPFVREDAFTTSWLDSTLDHLNSFVDTCVRLLPDVEQVRETLMRFLHAMVYSGERFYGLNAQDWQKEGITYQTIRRFDSVFATQAWVVQVIRCIHSSVHQRQDIAHSIRFYLDQNFMHDLPQSEVAARFHLNPSYFSHYFKQEFGQTYVQYLNTLRMEQAKRLLRTTQDSTESICVRVGIPNVNYFFRLFKKMEGRTVKAYRRSHKAKL